MVSGLMKGCMRNVLSCGLCGWETASVHASQALDAQGLCICGGPRGTGGAGPNPLLNGVGFCFPRWAGDGDLGLHPQLRNGDRRPRFY